MYCLRYCKDHIPPIQVGDKHQAHVPEWKEPDVPPKMSASEVHALKHTTRTIIQHDPRSNEPHTIGYWQVDLSGTKGPQDPLPPDGKLGGLPVVRYQPLYLSTGIKKE